VETSDFLAYLQFKVEFIFEQKKLNMDKHETNGHCLLQNGSDEDFELMGDMPREDPVIVEVRNLKQNIFFLLFNCSVVVHVIMK
jgi:hypothetical protein